ncbi:MAG TPA: hypothetical protein VK952_07830 [Methylotenera sp.]|nr:hypothetical protein [Methylotenera sp.]
MKIAERKIDMPNTTVKNADKIKLLDQMLEDIAGDELEEYDTPEYDINAEVQHYIEEEALDLIH